MSRVDHRELWSNEAEQAAFAPLPADADQRPGRERWPMLPVEQSA